MFWDLNHFHKVSDLISPVKIKYIYQSYKQITNQQTNKQTDGYNVILDESKMGIWGGGVGLYKWLFSDFKLFHIVENS